MSKIIEAADLPKEEKVYLKKDFMGWRVVQPLKNEDGSINWFNLLVGGKKNLITLIFIILIATLVYLGIREMIGNYQTIAHDPCNFCKTCQQAIVNSVPNFNLSLGGSP